MERSFFMIKPDAVAAGYVETIVRCLQKAEFEILIQKSKALERKDVMFLYPMHVFQDFFQDLVVFMISGPSELFIVKKCFAVESLNRLVGLTNPKENGQDTLRGKFGVNIRHNAVHSPNNPENAIREMLYFFPEINHNY